MSYSKIAQMKVSVVCTVLNEGDNIRVLMNSLVKQTRTPDEIVIVDGFSTDNTYQILQEYCEKYKYIKCLQHRGNISVGRNEAIKAAKYDVIAQIDAGCIAHKKWLERIIEPFSDPEVGLVAGFYDMTGDSPLQLAVAPFHGITPSRFDPRYYMPSGRSVAFLKSTWKKAGGYSENLQWAGEDTLFNYNVVKMGIKIDRVPSAYVFWEVPDTFLLTLKKFYRYAIGDAETGIWWHPGKNLSAHNIKIMSIYLRYFIFFVLMFLATFSNFFLYLLIIYSVVYVFGSIWKLIEDVRDTKARLLIPIIQITSDFAVMAGFLVGTLRQKKKLE